MIETIFKKNQEVIIQELNDLTSNHPIWRSPLFTRLREGSYQHQHLCFLFQQHHHYSNNFTKLLCLAASRMDESKYRAVIIENLYEEAGEEDIDKRHSELMSDFLRTLGIKPNTNIKSYTKLYVEQCIKFLSHCSDIEAAAFLAWGTESIVPRLYGYFINALKAIGMSEDDYRYFSLHIECDDGHHEALMEIALDIYNNTPDETTKLTSYQKMLAAVKKSLDMRLTYFDEIYNHLEQLSAEPIYESIVEKSGIESKTNLFKISDKSGKDLYQNTNENSNIKFSVQRTSLSPQVIDPRILKISPNSRTESHKHAHESLFYVLCGKGFVDIGGKTSVIEPGSMVYVPRWVLHHTENTSNEVLTILAITDYGLTGKFINNTESSYRENKENLSKTVLEA